MHSSYRLLATTKTSTMQEELQEAGAQGYILVGLTVGKTEIGGDEVVTILRRDDWYWLRPGASHDSSGRQPAAPFGLQ